jgi:hypothetical protein
MGALKKTLLIAFSVILLCAATGAGVVIYYYYHPSKIKPMVEGILSRSTGTVCSIENLSYATDPMRIEVTLIRMKPKGGGHGFDLEVPSLKAIMGLEGSFGNRTLVIRGLDSEGLSLRLSPRANLPALEIMPGSPSPLARAGTWLAAVFLFRDIRLEAGEITNGHVHFLLEGGSLEIAQVHARFHQTRPVEVTCSAEVLVPSAEASFRAPTVQVNTVGKVSLMDPMVKLSLAFQGASLKARQAEVQEISGKAQMVLEPGRRSLSFQSLDMRMVGMTSKLPLLRTPRPLEIELSGQATSDLRTGVLEAPLLHIQIPNLMEWAGSVKGHLGMNPRMEFTGMDCRIRPRNLLDLVPESLRANLRPFDLSGTVGLTGDLRLIRDSKNWRWECSGEARFKENRFSMSMKEIESRGVLSGRVRMEGRFPGVRVSSKLEAGQGLLVTPFARLEPFRMGLSLTGTWPRLEVDDLIITAPRVAISAAGRKVHVDGVRLAARKGLLDADRKSILLPETSLDSSVCKALKITLKADPEEARLGIKGQKAGLLEGLQSLDLLPGGWHFKGEDALQAEGVLKQGGGWSLSATCGIQHLEFQGPDPAWQGEKLSLKGEIQGKGSLEGPSITLTGSLGADRGEILLDRFYFDLSKNGLGAALKGSYRFEEKTFRLSDFQGRLKDLVSFSAEGTLSHGGQHPSFDVLLQLPTTPVEAAFQALLREPYGREIPFLQGLETGGAISADLRLAGRETDWTLAGRIGWREGTLASKEHTLSLRGIELDLPLWLESAKSSAPAKGFRAGKLVVDSLSVPGLPQQPLKMDLRAGPNRLVIESPTLLKTQGGIVELGPIHCEALLTSTPTIKTSLSVESLDLRPMLSDIWERPVEGTLKGRLDPVLFREGKVTSQGEITANVFGGELVIPRLSAAGLTTSTPVLTLDAHWEGLSLSELTKETSFGRIEGSLTGYVKNLEIAHGQPQRFELLLETVEKKGVAQRISVTAVDNIAQIGGGQSPFMGAAGLLSSFFREFPYSKIGVSASLENDVFKINGTIREDGMEYLVKRGSFSGVNVVNQNPDNRIRFKDMVSRIQRVGSSKGSPVVQ